MAGRRAVGRGLLRGLLVLASVSVVRHGTRLIRANRRPRCGCLDAPRRVLSDQATEAGSAVWAAGGVGLGWLWRRGCCWRGAGGDSAVHFSVQHKTLLRQTASRSRHVLSASTRPCRVAASLCLVAPWTGSPRHHVPIRTSKCGVAMLQRGPTSPPDSSWTSQRVPIIMTAHAERHGRVPGPDSRYQRVNITLHVPDHRSPPEPLAHLRPSCLRLHLTIHTAMTAHCVMTIPHASFKSLDSTQ